MFNITDTDVLVILQLLTFIHIFRTPELAGEPLTEESDSIGALPENLHTPKEKLSRKAGRYLHTGTKLYTPYKYSIKLTILKDSEKRHKL